jgi:hypothetical protein
MDEYPVIDGVEPQLLNEYPREDGMDEVLCTSGIYEIDDNIFFTIKPDYSRVEDDISHDNVRWTVLTGDNKECRKGEKGPFETVDKAVEYIKNN